MQSIPLALSLPIVLCENGPYFDRPLRPRLVVCPQLEVPVQQLRWRRIGDEVEAKCADYQPSHALYKCKPPMVKPWVSRAQNLDLALDLGFRVRNRSKK